MNDKTLAFLPACVLALVLPCTAAFGAPPAPAFSQVAQQGPLTLAFEDQWEPRTAATGVFGVVSTHVLQPTADGSDPHQTWASNSIWGKWGTLRTLDGSVPGLPDVTGLGPNPSWMAREGKLFFHAGPATGQGGATTGGFALISRASFPRSRRIVVEADLALTKGSEGAFVGMTLIAGEGNYRELALYRRANAKDTKDTIDRVTPLQSTVLADRKTDVTTMRIEYDPVDGFKYFANGQLLGKEALDQSGGRFSADPNVGLYFTGNSGVPNAFVEGFVGPVRVWVGEAPPVTAKGGSPD
jgi:hypothetical protein